LASSGVVDTADAAPLLSVEDLVVEFHNREGVSRVVDGVTFSVGRGETLGLLGESGCGKTVTSLALMRLLPSRSGRIAGGRLLFEGTDLATLSEEQMRRLRGSAISMILQDPLTSLNPVFSIRRQVVEALRLHREAPPDRGREKAAALLAEMRIPDADSRLDSYPHQFSGGMRQRVVSAIALAGNPRLLIADEPTTSLDVTVQAHFLRLLREIQDSHGLSIVFVTHDLGVIARICHRAAVMYAGRIVEEAPVRQLFAAPAHPYTRALLEASPRLEARKRPLTWIAGQPPSPRARPPGCAFAPRCPAAMERCRREAPPEIWIDQRHRAACWLHANGEDERHRDG